MANENTIDVKSKIITTSVVMTLTVVSIIWTIGLSYARNTWPGLLPCLLFVLQGVYLSWGWNWLSGVKVIEWKAVNETVQKDLDFLRSLG